MTEEPHQFQTRISFDRPISLGVYGDKWQCSLSNEFICSGNNSFSQHVPTWEICPPGKTGAYVSLGLQSFSSQPSFLLRKMPMFPFTKDKCFNSLVLTSDEFFISTFSSIHCKVFEVLSGEKKESFWVVFPGRLILIEMKKYWQFQQ